MRVLGVVPADRYRVAVCVELAGRSNLPTLEAAGELLGAAVEPGPAFVGVAVLGA